MVDENKKKKKFHRVDMDYEADRVWSGFREEQNVNANDFDNWGKMKEFLESKFDVHPNMKKIGDTGKGEILDEAKLWYDLEKGVKEEVKEIAPREAPPTERVVTEPLPTARIPEERIEPTPKTMDDEARDDMRAMEDRIKYLEGKIDETAKPQTVGQKVGGYVDNVVNTVNDITSGIMNRIRGLGGKKK